MDCVALPGITSYIVVLFNMAPLYDLHHYSQHQISPLPALLHFIKQL